MELLREIELINTIYPHNKFYKIALYKINNTYKIITKHGKIGITEVENPIANFVMDLFESNSFINNLVNVKLKKGYVINHETIFDEMINPSPKQELVSTLLKKKVAKNNLIATLESKYSIYSTSRLISIINEQEKEK